MLKITFTDRALDYLKRREIADKTLILITDDGGDKYSIKGGGCSIGSHFSIIWVDEKDPDYPVQLDNDQGLKIYTSKYDMTLMGPNMVMDYDAGSLNLRSDEGILDGGVEIGNGAALIKANKNVKMTGVEWRC
ncbi:iron-sulfur cluster biosynthesis family protein [Lactobacillus helveticus]|uniref:iron-sulfur cluster biosynthesis family protein n=1 Tax=Lactobacillus helveticus TaxID=1587 RepID=UPI0031E1A8D2